MKERRKKEKEWKNDLPSLEGVREWAVERGEQLRNKKAVFIPMFLLSGHSSHSFLDRQSLQGLFLCLRFAF